MSSFLIFAALVATSSVLAQDIPLASKHFQYTALVSPAFIHLDSSIPIGPVTGVALHG